MEDNEQIVITEEPQPVGSAFVEEEGYKRAVPWGWLFLIGALGTIAMIVTPNFLRARTRGHLTACKSNLKNMSTALEMYASDFQGNYPPSLEAMIPSNYLRAIPTCPGSGTMCYSYEVVNGKHANFTMVCTGSNHSRAYSAFQGSPEGYPQYSAERGLADHP